MASAFINPKEILVRNLELKRNMLAADFGCGSGEWTVSLAEILAGGKVYAVDLLEEPLSSVRSKARIKKLENIEIVKSDIEKTVSRLMANSLDLVLVTNMLFQAREKEAIFKEAKRVLKPGGKILVIDWHPNAAIGPEQKIPPEDLKNLAQSLGFAVAGEFAAGSFHFGLIFEKKRL